MRIIYYDFEINLPNIKKVTGGFYFNFNRNFQCLTCVNLACFCKYAEILNEIKTFKLDREKNLLIFYGKLSEKYNGDDHVRFLKSNDLRSGRCLWANNPHLIVPALRMADLIKI